MRTRKAKDRSRLIQAAMGQIPCDLTIGNVQFFNPSLREKSIRPVSTYWTDLLFWCVRKDRSRPAVQVVLRRSGPLPDPRLHRHAHAHREHDDDPREPRPSILPWGTTTVCTDPHEIGNVMGLDGVRFMLETRRSPSCASMCSPRRACVPARDGKRRGGVSCRGGRRTARHGRRCRHCRDHGLGAAKDRGRGKSPQRLPVPM